MARNAIADLMHQQSLLREEYEYDKKSFAQQSGLSSVEKKVAGGICWFPVSLGRSYFNTLNQYVIEVKRRATEDPHSFEFGKPVSFFSMDMSGQVREIKMAATVSYASETEMVVAIPSVASVAQLEGVAQLGVQLAFDETSYQAMFEALNKVVAAKNNRLAELREILSGNLPARFGSNYPVRFPWLNQSQERAVNKVLYAKDVAIVHGPPGTGKTTTLVEAVYETLRRETQVLVCAQSNMAVDWFSEQLVDRGVNVLRIGNPSRVNDKMLSFTYERKFEAHPKYDTLWGIRKTIRELYKKKRGSDDRSAVQNRIQRLKEEAEGLELEIRNSLFDEARVIACTLVGSSHHLLRGIHFSSLFIDEAAQALEPACWIPITKCSRVILAGDHCQLPPTIKSVEAARKGLDQTLMQKIVEAKQEAVSLLTVQYRMNEAIMRFSSDWFYDGKLVAADEVKHRGILDFDAPIEWIDTAGDEVEEEYVEQSAGRLNRVEADRLLDEMEKYIGRIGAERILEENIDFGIISPYKAQVFLLRRLMHKRSFFKPFRRLITINSVDGFQGQERDVILLSLVRANEEGRIGFLSDYRRMNVAITRARMKLIVLGNVQTLTRHAFYRKLHGMIDEMGDF